MTSKPAFTDTTPAAARYRAEQAHIDADIEGLARDPELDSRIEQWRAEGLSFDERRKRLDSYFRSEDVLVAE